MSCKASIASGHNPWKWFNVWDLKPKPWASSEITFVENFLAKINEIIVEPEKIAMDLEYVLHQLERRFNKSEVETSERRRKARRSLNKSIKLNGRSKF